MSVNITAQTAASLAYSFSEAMDIGGTVALSNSASSGNSYTHGSGEGQVNSLPRPQKLTIAPSGTATLDLHGVLPNPSGSTVAMTGIRAILISLPDIDGQASAVLVGGGTSPVVSLWGAAGDQLRIYKSGSFMLDAGKYSTYAVTGGSADILTFTNSDATNTATVYVSLTGIQ